MHHLHTHFVTIAVLNAFSNGIRDEVQEVIVAQS